MLQCYNKSSDPVLTERRDSTVSNWWSKDYAKPKTITLTEVDLESIIRLAVESGRDKRWMSVEAIADKIHCVLIDQLRDKKGK